MIVRSITVLLLATGLTFGQGVSKKDASKEPSKPTPGSLEDTLDKALRNSADIKAAEAKVREAEAQLNVVRQQVLTKATSLHSDLNLAKRMLIVAEQALATQEQLVKMGAPGRTAETVLAAQALVEKHRGEVEKLETELKSLRGEFPVKSVAFSPDGGSIYVKGFDGAVRLWDTKTGALLDDVTTAAGVWWAHVDGTARSTVQPPMAERIRALLDQEVELTGNPPLGQAVGAVLAAAKSDVPVRTILNQVQMELRADLPKGKLPVGAWIQAIEDTDAKVVVVVRDYGLLVTMKDRVPTNAVGVSELWKSKPKVEPKPEKK